MKILILGGHGFVGKSLAGELEGTEHEVFPISRRDGVDLKDFEAVRKCFKDIEPDAIINCAAHVGSLHYVTTYAADVVHDNVQMALNIYEAAKDACGSARIVNPLSNCSYPGDANTHYEPDWWNGEVHDSVFSYGNSKRMIYVISQCYGRQYGIRSVNFLVPNTFGPGDYTDPNKTHALNGMIIRMITAQREGEKEFEIWGTGKPIREWGYIQDVVDMLVLGLTIEDDLTYPVNLAQNRGYSIRESAEFIAEAIGFDGKLVFNTKYQDGAPFKILDDRKFRSIFPDYDFFDHKKGIEETVKYYKSVL
jgi:GDP-L-fucose synthase